MKELAPISLDNYQNIKYSDDIRWETLQKWNQTLERYEVEGEVPARTVLGLDDAAWSMKRSGMDYSGISSVLKGKLNSKIRKGNSAVILFNDQIYYTHSRFNDIGDAYTARYSGEYPIIVAPDKSRYRTLDLMDGIMRSRDTEAKIFEFLAQNLTPESRMDITILSEKNMCKSCRYVMKQFKKEFPNVNINIISGKRGYNNDKGGLKTWTNRW